MLLLVIQVIKINLFVKFILSDLIAKKNRRFAGFAILVSRTLPAIYCQSLTVSHLYLPTVFFAAGLLF